MRRRLANGMLNVMKFLACVRIVVVAVALGAFAANGIGTAWASGLRPYTIDDALKLERVGKAAADPTGHWFVWEYGPPYDTLNDYSDDHIGTFNSGYRLMVVDLKAAKPVSVPLLPADPNRIYHFDSFSPDGRYVAFYDSNLGHIGMGVYDTQTKAVHYFDPTPLIDWSAGRESTWTSNDTFVYSAYPPGHVPLPGFRKAFGERMWDAWNKSWAGKVSVPAVAESHAGTTPLPFDAGTLYKADARTGALTTVGDGKFLDINVSHDGRYLAALRQAPRSQPDPAKPDLDWIRSRSQLQIFDLVNGGPPRIVAPDRDVYPVTMAWSPIGDRLAFYSWKLGAGVQSGIFSAVDATTGSITPYAHTGLDIASERERGFAQKPERVMWIGDRLALFARENPPGDTTPRLTYREIAGLDTMPPKADWFLLSANGEHQNLTRPFKSISSIPLYADATSFDVLADGGVWRLEPGKAPSKVSSAIADELSLSDADRYNTLHRAFVPTRSFVATGAGGRKTAFVNFVTGKSFEVASTGKNLDPLATSSAAATVLYHLVDGTQNAVMMQGATGAPILLARLNKHLDDIARTTYKPISYPVHTAVKSGIVTGCVLLPPSYVPGRRYPVIVDVYPSTGARCLRNPPDLELGAGVGLFDYEHLMAARGYIIFKANTERAYSHTPAGPINGMPDMAVQGADALIKAGYADPNRLAITGLSQGGFSSLYVLTQTNRFKAAVSSNSWTDMYTHSYEANYGSRFFSDEDPWQGEAGRYTSTAGTDFGIGKTPQQDLDVYVKNSPLYLADKINTPVLLFHSDEDMFAVDEYEELFTALYQQRKEASLVEYMGEGHTPSSPANIRDALQREFAWFDKYLDVARDAAGNEVWSGNTLKGR